MGLVTIPVAELNGLPMSAGWRWWMRCMWHWYIPSVLKCCRLSWVEHWGGQKFFLYECI